jgi:hypothetical protein
MMISDPPAKRSQTTKFAALALRDAPPNSQVLVDGERVGTTGADGVFNYDRVSAGIHRIELQNSPQYKPKTLLRTFEVAGTVLLAGDWTALERSPAPITLKVTPKRATLRWQCGQNPPQVHEGSLTVECAGQQFSVTAESDGYETASKVWPVTPGEAREFNLALSPAATLTTRRPACGSGELLKAGWKLDDDWLVASQSQPVPCDVFTGTYQFTLQVPRGLWTKPVSWTWKMAIAPELTFQLDKKSITLPGGVRKELSEYADNGSVKFRIVVEASGVSMFVQSKNSWIPIGAFAGEARTGKLIMSRNVRIKDLSISEK